MVHFLLLLTQLTYPAQNAESVINNNTGHYLGQRGDGASYLNGYHDRVLFHRRTSNYPLQTSVNLTLIVVYGNRLNTLVAMARMVFI
jgi:hypothetical protein